MNPLNLDRPSSVNRASGERNPFPSFAGPRFELIGVVALALAASCVWFYQTFLEAVPAISRVIGGK